MASRATAAADTAAAPPRVAPTPIAEKLSRLRELAATEPAQAQEETWSWIKELGKAHDEEALNELFELGIPLPWLAKRFDAAGGSGDNVLANSARWPAKLLWPLYGTKPSERGRAAFDFETAVEPSKSGSEIEALKIDYGPLGATQRSRRSRAPTGLG
jgi:hypothetical protein